MTPNPVSSSATPALAGPAAMPGGAPNTAFAQALARQRASQLSSPQPASTQPVGKPATATGPGSAGAASPPAAPSAQAGQADNPPAEADASDELQDREGQDDTPASPSGIDALLSRLAGADPVTTPGAPGTFGPAPTQTAQAGQAGAQATATEATDVLAEAAVSGPGLGARAGLAMATARGSERETGLGTSAKDKDALSADPTGAELASGATARAADALSTAARDGSKDSAKDGGKGREDTSTLQAAASIDKSAAGASGLGTGALTATAVASPTPTTPALPTGAPGSASTPLPEARLAAPPGHADFAPQLGAQITVFVREGLQQARLQLNPAEMGPITVQIRLEGNAAQVHLAADNALTRQALEQAMPTLASSLREGGLTLTGGGVFEQPGQPGQANAQGQGAAGGGQGRTGQGSAALADVSWTDGDTGHSLDGTSLPLRSRGVVDLVA